MNDPVEFLLETVSIPSETGKTEDVLDLLRTRCTEWGMDTAVEAGALIVNPEARKLLLLGHFDTVPGGPDVRLEDGELWGRGSVDAKGPLCTALWALKEDQVLWKDVMLIAVPDEEGDSGTAYRLRDELPEMPALILEPSGSSGITISYNGRLLLKVIVEKERSHSGHEEPFASEEAVSIYEKINEVSRARILEFNGRIENAEMTLDIRYGIDKEPEIRDGSDGASIEVLDDVKPSRSDKRSILVRSFMRGIRGSGLKPVFKKKTGTSDMNVIGEKWNSPMIAYGPGDGIMDHTDHERISVEEYLQGISVMKKAVKDFVGA